MPQMISTNPDHLQPRRQRLLPTRLLLLLLASWVLVCLDPGIVRTATGDVTNWIPWVSLPEPRTNAQAHVIGHFVFLVGGTEAPFGFNNISETWRGDRLSPSSSDADATSAPSQPTELGGTSFSEILWIDFNDVDRWHDLPLGERAIVPISAKSGSVATDSSIFLSYAADILQPENNAFVEVRLPSPISAISPNVERGRPAKTSVQPATVHNHAPSIVLRNSAALGRIKTLGPPTGAPSSNAMPSILDELPTATFAMYLFGGRTANSVPVPEVEMFYNGTWSVVATLDINTAAWTCNCAIAQPGTGVQRLVLSGCLHCVSGLPVPYTLVFDASVDPPFFHPTQYAPLDYTNPNFLPNDNGGAGQMLFQFMPTVYENEALNSTAINLYDQLLRQENQIVTVDIQARRTECAEMNAMGFVFCIGGTSFPDGAVALPYSDAAQVRPAPQVSFDHTDMNYLPGEEVTIFAGRTCGAPTSVFRLSATPQCDVRLPYVDDVPCDASTTFRDASTIALRPGEVLNAYLCYTEGSCGAQGADRVDCGGNLTNDDCRWYPCCWDNVAQRCFAYSQPDALNEASTYFTNAISRPLVFALPPIPPPAPKLWYHSTAFYVGASLGSVVVVYFVLALVWKSRVQCEALARQEVQSSPFTAFGKNYNVIGQIGQGSFGTVFLAERMSDGKQVALKVLPCNDAKQRNLALSEYDVIHNLRHANLIRVLDLILNWDTATAVEQDPEERKKRSIARGSPARSRSGGAGVALTTSRRRQPDEASLLVSPVVGPDGQAVGSINAYDAPKSRESNEELRPTEVPLLHNDSLSSTASLSPPQQQQGGAPRARQYSDTSRGGSSVKAYGSFNKTVHFGSAANIERRDLDFIAACPRFICIVTDYYPDGDLRDFVLNYGLPKKSARGALAVAASSTSSTSSTTGGIRCCGDRTAKEQRTNTNKTTSSSIGSSAEVSFAVAPIPERLVRAFALQLSSLLQYMHSRKKPVVHRDLKPENVLMDGERLIVTDFGLAGVQDNADYMGTRAGTLFFSPPESLMRQEIQVTPAVDMWALGCILYAVCTRRVLPETTRVMFVDVDDDDFESSMRSDLAHYSLPLQDMILATLRKDPQSRMTAEQAVRLTEELLRDNPIA